MISSRPLLASAALPQRLTQRLHITGGFELLIDIRYFPTQVKTSLEILEIQDICAGKFATPKLISDFLQINSFV
jgi:hypothetical protein